MESSTTSKTPTARSNAVFATTQWTQVLEARGSSNEAQDALSSLSEAYYPPVFAFIRFSVRDEETARDLTQEFFARLLTRHGIDSVDPQRGRFRSFLLGAVKHFLADMRDHAARLKRGGGQPVESLEQGTDTSTELQVPDIHLRSPEKEFDRKWALTVLERALAALAHEHRALGKAAQLDALKPWLTGETAELSQEGVARQLGVNEGAVKVAIHRLRRRFRELVKTEISQTLKDPAQTENELAGLIAALREEP